MILYKYLHTARLDVLRNKRIRFTQPGDFNDPFEFRPWVENLASPEYLSAFVDENFERLVDESLAKYDGLANILPVSTLRNFCLAQKSSVPQLIKLLEPPTIEATTSIFSSIFNSSVGVLCLSEVPNSILMWGHYAENHHGFVIGFDSDHAFFNRKRSEQDEFGFLRKVDYQTERPRVTIADTTSPVWFQTKPEQWAYEKEWRILRVLSEAEYRAENGAFPICLFEFPIDAVREIVVGLRSPSLLVQEIRSLASCFPKATLLRACEDLRSYSLSINKFS